VNLHEIHVTDLTDFTKKKIDCYDCHTVIAHGTVTR
jgi:nitrate/TMAO reductase-like tetraheme cytochrome c subunit